MSYLGIDFGTSTTIVSCVDENGEVITLSIGGSGKTVVPSMIYYKEKDLDNVKKSVEIGGLAESNGVLKPEALVKGFKLDFNNDEIKKYDIKAENGERLGRSVMGVATDFFTKLMGEVTESLRKRFPDNPELCNYEKIILTVPVDFSKKAIENIKEALITTGYITSDKLDHIHEPTSAAIAYLMDNNCYNDPMNILVYDFGGGTFDVSIVQRTSRGMESRYRDGSTDLGGDRLTQRIVEDMIARANARYDMDMPDDPKKYTPSLRISSDDFRINYTKIQFECDKRIKLLLSSDDGLDISGVINIRNGEKDENFDYKYTREELISLIKKDVNKTIAITEELLKEANTTIDALKERIVELSGSNQELIEQLSSAKSSLESVYSLLGKAEEELRNSTKVINTLSNQKFLIGGGALLNTDFKSRFLFGAKINIGYKIWLGYLAGEVAFFNDKSFTFGVTYNLIF